MKRCFAVAAAMSLIFSTNASAALLDAPLPSDAYITFDNLEWAWAYPFPASYGGFDLSYQSWAGLPGAPPWADQLVVRAIPDVTAIPNALPLFATGLGALGLLGWRRKRKNAALVG
jgi:hypothetical protein